MMNSRIVLSILTIGATSIAVPLAAQHAGMMQGSQQQQQMGQMQDMMRQMGDMGQRTQHMQQQMKQQTDRMPSGQMSAAHTAMPQMVEHMSAMTTQMKGLMGQYQAMTKDPLMKDQAMQHDMDDMRDHMAAMSSALGKTLESMEQVQKRLGASPMQPMKP